MNRFAKREIAALTTAALIALAGAVGVQAQEESATSAPAMKIAVIDVQRLVSESEAGKEVFAVLDQKSEEKKAELQVLAEELESLRTQLNEGRLSLSEDRLGDLQRQVEDKTIALRRARDDAQRELQELQGRRLAEIERRVMPIINRVGVEGGYALIFNKYESGLVFAQDTVDITDEILRRFDASVSDPGSDG